MHTSLVLLQNKEVNKEWQGWDRGGDDILLNYMSGGSPTQSHYNHTGGCHQEKPTQTNKQKNKRGAPVKHKSLEQTWYTSH